MSEHAAGISREQLERLVSEGMTIREIAAAAGRCQATVKHWLNRYGLKTQRATRPRLPDEKGSPRPTSATRTCPVHGETEFVLSQDGYYRCRRCRVDSVVRRRKRVKEILATEAGGRCAICGYDRCLGALHFHHLNPAEKRLGLSRAGVTLALEVLRLEAKKCVLLCSNCHAEVEGGVATLPIQ